jgi:hypothetical protein
MASLSTAWQSAKVVRTREKITFFLGVMSLLITALIFGMAPQYVAFHISCGRGAPISDMMQLVIPGGCTSHTRFKLSTSFLCVHTNTRNARGIISCSTFVTTQQSSISSSSG